MTPGKLYRILTVGEDLKRPARRADSETESSDEEPSNRTARRGPPMRVNLYGQVYDLAEFAPRHPGGVKILERLVENKLPDATPLFESYHAMKDPAYMKKVIAPYATGEKVPSLYSFEDDGFYRRARRRVAEHLRKTRPAAFRRQDYLWSHAKAILGFLAWAGFLLRAASLAHSGAVSSVIGWSVMAGLALISWGFVMMHDASHFAFTRSPEVNEAAATLWNTVAYWNSDIWAIHHAVRHHSYTGSFGLDPDMDHAVPLIRKTSQSEADLYLGLSPMGQVLSITIFPGMYFGQLVLYLRHRLSGMMAEALGEFSIRKAAWWQYPFYAWFPLWFAALLLGGGLTVAFCAFFAYIVAANVAYAVNILPDHDTRPSHVAEELANKSASGDKLQDWGEIQVRCSANWSGRAWCEVWGGINFQIEHHLFPTLHHSLLPEVAPIIREECEKHSLPYVAFPTIFSALSSVVTQLSAVADGKDD